MTIHSGRAARGGRNRKNSRQFVNARRIISADDKKGGTGVLGFPVVHIDFYEDGS